MRLPRRDPSARGHEHDEPRIVIDTCPRRWRPPCDVLDCADLSDCSMSYPDGVVHYYCGRHTVKTIWLDQETGGLHAVTKAAKRVLAEVDL